MKSGPQASAICVQMRVDWSVSLPVPPRQAPMFFALQRSSASMVLLIPPRSGALTRSEEHTSELQSLMRISYAVFCLKKKKIHKDDTHRHIDRRIQHKRRLY